jgi:hypothetical protein
VSEHKASIKVEFSIYGETYKTDSWINWSVGGEVYEIDDRVLNFFRDSYLDARGKYDEASGEADRKRAAETERLEREELARLKAKYDK